MTALVIFHEPLLIGSSSVCIGEIEQTVSGVESSWISSNVCEALPNKASAFMSFDMAGKYVELGRVGSSDDPASNKYSAGQLRLYQSPNIAPDASPITTYSAADAN